MEGNGSLQGWALHLCNNSHPSYNSCSSSLTSTPVCSLPKVGLITLLSVITILANATLLHIIRTNKALKTTSNLYIVSLSISDLLVGLVIIPFNVVDICLSWDPILWTHGLWVTADFFFTSESILHYVLFNLDRYWSINAPFKYIRKRSRRKTIMHIAGTWGIGIVMILSPAITWMYGFPDLTVPSKRTFYDFKQSSWLMCTDAILIYFTPLLILCAIYCKIFRTLSRRTKMGIGRTSVSSTVFSNKQCNSRGPSESMNTSPSPLITENDLIRLRNIYEQTIKRERTARHLKMTFPLHKRQNTTPGTDINRYDSIEEENDDTQEAEECSPLNREQPDQRNQGLTSVKYVNGTFASLDRKSEWNEKTPCNGYVPHYGDDNVFSYSTLDPVKADICTCELIEPEYEDLAMFARPKSYPSIVAHCVSVASKSCSGDPPKKLKMAEVEQIKTFGGIVCPNCSKTFADIGMIKHADLQDYTTTKNSLGSGSSNYDQSTYEQSTSVSSSDDDKRDTYPQLLPHDQNIGKVDRSDDHRCVPCDHVSHYSDTSIARRVSMVNNVTQPNLNKDTLVNFQLARSRRNSFPSIHTSLSPMQHRNSVGDLTNRVRQSVQNSFSAISGKSSRALNILRQQEKAVKQLGITLACMFLCWTPYFLQVLIYSFSPGSANVTILSYSVYLGYFHSFCNPVLIIVFNLKIRRAFKKALRCFPEGKKKREHIHPIPSAL